MYLLYKTSCLVTAHILKRHDPQPVYHVTCLPCYQHFLSFEELFQFYSIFRHDPAVLWLVIHVQPSAYFHSSHAHCTGSLVKTNILETLETVLSTSEHKHETSPNLVSVTMSDFIFRLLNYRPTAKRYSTIDKTKK